MKTKAVHESYLNHIKEILESQSIPSELQEKAIDNKIDTLFIPFQDTGIGLTLTYISSRQLNEANVESDVCLLQYHIAVPVKIEKAMLPTVSEFIHRLNLNSPLPGWILDRANSAIHYRHVQLTDSEAPSDALVRYVLNMISFYNTTFFPLLVNVCLGKEKIEDATRKLEQAMKAPAGGNK